MLAVEALEQTQFELLHFFGGRPAVQIRNGFRPGEDSRPLVAAGQKIGTPDLAPGVRQIRRKDDKRRQILIFGPEAIRGP